MKNTTSRMFAASVLFLICHYAPAAEPSLFSFQLSKVRNIRGLKVPLGMQGNAKPTVSVYFGEISVESKRAGFFRIGPIPQPVVSGMRVDILEPEGGSGWADDFARFAAGEASLDRANIRGIEIHSSAKDNVSVRADVAQFIANSRTLRLRGVQVFAEGQPIRRFIVGEVHLIGAKAGQLEWTEGECIRSISLSGLPSTPDGGNRMVPR